MVALNWLCKSLLEAHKSQLGGAATSLQLGKLNLTYAALERGTRFLLLITFIISLTSQCSINLRSLAQLLSQVVVEIDNASPTMVAPLFVRSFTGLNSSSAHMIQHMIDTTRHIPRPLLLGEPHYGFLQSLNLHDRHHGRFPTWHRPRLNKIPVWHQAKLNTQASSELGSSLSLYAQNLGLHGP
ncbi:hypothetical protein U1Q18_019995 [Sarracenia purpurea var. burkii]